MVFLLPVVLKRDGRLLARDREIPPVDVFLKNLTAWLGSHWRRIEAMGRPKVGCSFVLGDDDIDEIS